MRDMYNDSTGSRKKFLIPLVVLLLCAVSLTGAGYAYNSSVTINGGSADIDEYFTLDLYKTDSDTLITSNAQVTTDKVDGLLVTTAKTINATEEPHNYITGSLAIEDMDVALYTGHFKINSNDIQSARYATLAASGVNAVLESATLFAKHDDQNNWIKGTAESKEATFSVANPVVTPADVSAKFFSDEACTNEISIFAIDGTDYYFQIYLKEFAGTVTQTAVDGEATLLDAKEFAKAVAASLTIKFDFTLTATAVENAPIVTLDANDGTGKGVAVFVQDGALVGEAINITKDGSTLKGFYTAANSGDMILKADGTVVKNVDGYTDADGKWIYEGSTELFAQWDTPSPSP